MSVTTTKIPSTFKGSNFVMSGSNRMEGTIHDGKVLSFNGKKSFIKDCSFKASIGILYKMDKIDCINTAFEAPLIVFPSPDSLSNNGCTLTGKVVYLSDKSTCEEYGSTEWLAATCNPTTHDEI